MSIRKMLNMVDYKEKGCCFGHCRYNMRKDSMSVLIGVHPKKKTIKKLT